MPAESLLKLKLAGPYNRETDCRNAEFAIRSTHKLHVLYRRLVPYPYAFLRGQIVGNSKAPLIASLKRLGMRARNPPALPAGIADQQPAVPCVFDCDFLTWLHGQFPCRIIREDPGFLVLRRDQLDGNPSFAFIRSATPLPSRKFLVLSSNVYRFTSNNLYGVWVLSLVFHDDARFVWSLHNLGWIVPGEHLQPVEKRLIGAPAPQLSRSEHP